MEVKTKMPEYKIWAAMKGRCSNPNNKSYKNYGGRGIKVCDRWLESFENFIDDLGKRPDGMTLERVNVNGDYTPENCKWASIKEQNQNHRKQRNNTSGVTGVEYKERDSAWMARWNDENGVQKSKHFSVGKFGYDEAFKMASKHRSNMLSELNEQGSNYTSMHGKDIKEMLSNLNVLSKTIHEENFEKGWWNCTITGEDMRDNIYFQAAKMLLIHAETSEAAEGLRCNSMDAKLPEYPEEAVELVDTMIRILDYCGMKGYNIGEIMEKKINFNQNRSDHKLESRVKKGGKIF